MEERSMCGSGGCVSCPFSENEYAIQAQNWACLPAPWDIVQMKRQSGHNWACHADENVLCGGFANHLKDLYPELNIKEGNLISYDAWYHKGPEAAMAEADKKSKESKESKIS